MRIDNGNNYNYSILAICIRGQAVFSGRHCAVIIAEVRDKASMLSGNLLLFLENYRERYIKMSKE